jgi:hypothetical protein
VGNSEALCPGTSMLREAARCRIRLSGQGLPQLEGRRGRTPRGAARRCARASEVLFARAAELGPVLMAEQGKPPPRPSPAEPGAG